MNSNGAIRRVAFLSMHTSPLDQPGAGEAGGMNVYMNDLAGALASRGVETTVFTRRNDPSPPEMIKTASGYRVSLIDAGPPRPAPAGALAEWVGDYAGRVIDRMREEGEYDLVHSHYWLSGWAGRMVKQSLGLPLANSFHTLGRVKDATRRPGQPPEPLSRIAAENEVIAAADCVIVSSEYEADELIGHYRADPGRVCINPPGIDLRLFQPGDRTAARRKLGMGDEPLILFAGRIQPLKGADVAVRALATVRESLPGARLALVGGPSGPDGEEELAAVRREAARLGAEGAVTFYGPRPHREMPLFYQAADALAAPSRSESFCLVAVEGQACGTPVVAANVGGLRYVVSDRRSGILVDGWEAADYGRALLSVLHSPALREDLSAGAIANAERFGWELSTERLLELYKGIMDAAR